MIIKSKTINENLNSLDICNNKNSKSFCDFGKLLLCGSQKILTFGEYSIKQNNQNTQNKKNKRKVIYYFYKKNANSRTI